jgi:SHS2 domain-containing protein
VRVKGSLVKSIDRTIKAVTFHNLEVKETSKGFTTLITFDV